jgi:hypothetical protein
MCELKCLDQDASCAGPVEYRMAMSGTGKRFPRCDYHFSLRLDQQEAINRRYPETQPSDFDPLYAGERWYEDE